MDCAPGTPHSKARRLNAAISKSVRDMSLGDPPKALLLEKAFRVAASDFGHPKVSALMDVVKEEMEAEDEEMRAAAEAATLPPDAWAELHSA